jgi:hypothetical protein
MVDASRRRRRRIGGAVALLVAVLTAAGGAVVAVHAATSSVRPPPVAARFDYQLGGAYRPAAGVRVVDRDRTDPAAPGRYSICYLNAFQTQPEEARFWLRRHPHLLLRTAAGKPVEDPDWPGEYVLDISSAHNRAALARIVGRWIDGCAEKGYRAVEPDNLDTFTRWPRRITAADALHYSRLLADSAHHRGMAIAQKNAPDLGRRGKAIAGFDFAIAEECQVYRECARYTAVYGRHVIEIEYTDTPRAAFAAACRARGSRISVQLRDRDVVPRNASGYRAEWCTSYS